MPGCVPGDAFKVAGREGGEARRKRKCFSPLTGPFSSFPMRQTQGAFPTRVSRAWTLEHTSPWTQS